MFHTWHIIYLYVLWASWSYFFVVTWPTTSGSLVFGCNLELGAVCECVV
jgi:hypothetical protein